LSVRLRSLALRACPRDFPQQLIDREALTRSNGGRPKASAVRFAVGVSMPPAGAGWPRCLPAEL
jgi:hypothetical protein